MELLYYWIEDDKMTIQEQGFNFSDKYNFEFVKSSDESYDRTLVIKHEENFIEGFFNTKSMLITERKGDIPKPLASIKSVTGIIGENGVGKTNLMHHLIDLLNNKLPADQSWLVAFFNKSSKSIEITHTLAKTITVKNELESVVVDQPKKAQLQEEGPKLVWKDSYKISSGKVIYYNPAFDLRNYPPAITLDSKSYIDISTTGLIEADKPLRSVSLHQGIDKVLAHKYSNVQRQIELTTSNLAGDIIGLNIPSVFKVVVSRNTFDPKEHQNNLTAEAEAIFYHLDSLIQPAFNEVDTKLKESSLSNLDSEVYYALEAEKVKVEFCYCMIHNYFSNLQREYRKDIGVKLENISGAGLLERTSHFFSLQTITDAAYTLLEQAFEYMDSTDFEVFDAYSEFNTFECDTIGAFVLMSNYEEYLNAFKGSSYRNAFLNLDWRDLSSGEKVKLDLYSRLLHAKKLLSPADKENVYIIIDEGELGYHPQWQKDYFFYLIDFIWSCFTGCDVQLFITSHSPFIASDLPKQNLIFLEKQEGKCVVHGLEKEETFASNIHTLYSDSFFLSDGLLGKFSREKLNDLIDKLNGLNELNSNEKPTKKELQNYRKLIAMIGEPVIREKLNEILEEEISAETPKERISRLKREIEEAEEEERNQTDPSR